MTDGETTSDPQMSATFMCIQVNKMFSFNLVKQLEICEEIYSVI